MNIDLLSAAHRILSENGFSHIPSFKLERLDDSKYALFEDPFSIVAVVVYETWADLLGEWQGAQSSFVELISKHISKEEQKRWDAYLVLWTSDVIPLSEIGRSQKIQYDTSRVRKMVSAGDQLKSLADINKALTPLLPLSEVHADSVQDNALDLIPRLLQTGDLSEDKIRAVVTAFDQQESLMEVLHSYQESL